MVSCGRSETPALFASGVNTTLEDDTLAWFIERRERSELLPAEHRASSIASFHDNSFCCRGNCWGPMKPSDGALGLLTRMMCI